MLLRAEMHCFPSIIAHLERPSPPIAEQVGVVDGYQAGSLLLRTAQVAVTAMQEFQVGLGLGRAALNPGFCASA